MSLEVLLQRASVWRGGEHSPRRQPALPSGHAELDRQLGGGWPLGSLVELLTDHHGIGELGLLLPALVTAAQERLLVWVGPPHLPYAPALAAAGIPLSHLLWVRPENDTDTLWATEQALRSGSCGAVLCWPGRAEPQRLRRLQLAAEQGHSLAFLFRPHRVAAHASPAAVRLELSPNPAGLELHLIKRRGGWATAPFIIPPTHGRMVAGVRGSPPHAVA